MGRIRIEPNLRCDVDAFRWQRRGVGHLTVLVHQRFVFVQDEPARATEWRARSAPLPRVFAPQPEVAISLIGSAHAANATPTTSTTVRLGLYANDAPVFDKTIFVFGDRSPENPAITRTFTEMPLTWARAQRTPLNPTGSLLPNLVDTREPHKAVGFDLLPIDMHCALIGMEPRALLGDELVVPDELPLAELFPAQKDQRVRGLAGDEWILLDGMTTGHARLLSRLSRDAWLAKGTLVDAGIDWQLPLSLSAITIDADDQSFVCSYVGERELDADVAVSLSVSPLAFAVEWPVHVGSSPETRSAPAEPRVHRPEPRGRPAAPVDEETASGITFAPNFVATPFGTTADLTGIAAAIPPLGATPWERGAPSPESPRAAPARVPPRPTFEVEETVDLPGFLAKRGSDIDETFLGGVAEGDALPFSESPMTTAPTRPSTDATPWDRQARRSGSSTPEWRPSDLASESTMIVESSALVSDLESTTASESTQLPAPLERSEEPPLDATPPPPPASAPVSATPPTSPSRGAEREDLGVPPRAASEPPAASPIVDASAGDAVSSGIAALARLRAGEVGSSYAGVDFSGLDLTGMDLDGIDFTGARFSRARLTGSSLRRATLSDACLEGADLEGSNLEGAMLVGARLSGANLTRARLASADLSKASGEGVRFSLITARAATFELASFSRSTFDGADLESARFDDATLTSSSYRDARCNKASFLRCRLSGSDLTNVDFKLAVLRAADLEGATLDKVQASRGDLSGANLRGASLRDASLRETKLTQACLVDAIVSGADLRDATLNDADFAGVDLKSARVSRAALNKARNADIH